MTARDDRAESDAGLATKLGRFVLIAHASGLDVGGDWNFVDTDAMVPDFGITITRVDDGPAAQRQEAEVAIGPRDPEDFKTGLYDLLLGEYARGNDVTGHWRLRYAASELPEWAVRIEAIGTESDTDADRPRGTF